MTNFIPVLVNSSKSALRCIFFINFVWNNGSDIVWVFIVLYSLYELFKFFIKDCCYLRRLYPVYQSFHERFQILVKSLSI